MSDGLGVIRVGSTGEIKERQVTVYLVPLYLNFPPTSENLFWLSKYLQNTPGVRGINPHDMPRNSYEGWVVELWMDFRPNEEELKVLWETVRAWKPEGENIDG